MLKYILISVPTCGMPHLLFCLSLSYSFLILNSVLLLAAALDRELFKWRKKDENSLRYYFLIGYHTTLLTIYLIAVIALHLKIVILIKIYAYYHLISIIYFFIAMIYFLIIGWYLYGFLSIIAIVGFYLLACRVRGAYLEIEEEKT